MIRLADDRERDATDRRARLEIVSGGARLDSHRLIRPNEGNISRRMPGGGFLITPTRKDTGRLDPLDCVLIDLESSTTARASSEAQVHRRVYEKHPRIQAIVHAHPPAVLRMARARSRPPESLIADGSVLLGSVAWLGLLEPGSQELAEAVARSLDGRSVVVLDRHGAFTTGNDVDQAIRRMLVLEHLADVGHGTG